MASPARTALQLADPPAVLVAEGRALFRGFIETESAVVEVLAGADDPEMAAHRLLALGARAAGYVAASTQAEAIQTRMEAMTATVETAVGQTLSELHQATASTPRTANCRVSSPASGATWAGCSTRRGATRRPPA